MEEEKEVEDEDGIQLPIGGKKFPKLIKTNRSKMTHHHVELAKVQVKSRDTKEPSLTTQKLQLNFTNR